MRELCAELDRIASSLSVPSGTMLFRCGEPVSGVYLVRKGAISLSLEAAANHVFPPRTLGPGDIAGLPATLTGHYSLSAQVIEDADIGFVPAHRVAELFEASPRLCLLATRFISEEIARMRSLLKDIPPLDNHE